MQQTPQSHHRTARHGEAGPVGEVGGRAGRDRDQGFAPPRRAPRGREPRLPFSDATARAALAEIVEGLQSIRATRDRLDAEEARLLEWASRLADAEAAQMSSGNEHEIAHRTANAELAAAVQLSDRTVERRVAQSVSLVRDFPGVHEALANGRVDRPRAVAICEAGGIVPQGQRRERYEEEALRYAEAESVNRVRPHVAQLAERFTDRSIDERHTEAHEGRGVTVTPLSDGMALLQAVLSARDAKTVHARLTQCARELRVTQFAAHEAGEALPQDPRTVDQRRADALVEIVAGWNPSELETRPDPPFQAKVQVTVPVSKLHGVGAPADSGVPVARDASADAGVLAGFGPIDTESARWFAAIADHWDILKVDDERGEVLEVERYRPSERMRRRLAARDLHCRFPGCRVPAVGCDLDHTVDAALGGRTATDNLAHLCRWHHTLKHHSPWRVEQRPGGVLEWTSPTGRTYQDRPASRVRFRRAGRDSEEDSCIDAGVRKRARARMRSLSESARHGNQDPHPF
ncbi:HNH endonuclease signature motif containing protein [Leucobacter sp. Psy1]|uniref:HNH endonuclease signature motif containing protein n=1 Tax=Leucobacter sp. Psy1 TaxID=2875729 RepID=UPI001CD41743|nr:HNH endonuclease signature motif containing protein [Leucobacter sp. Psy1]